MGNSDLLIKLIDELKLEEDELKNMTDLISKYRKGTLFVQRVGDSDYFYRKYNSGGKTKCEYIGKNLNSVEINNIKTEFLNYKTLKKRISNTSKNIQMLKKDIERYKKYDQGY